MTELALIEPYRDAAEHARDELTLVGLLASRAVQRGRATAWVPRAPGADEPHDAADIEAASRSLVATIEGKLAACRAGGMALPMDLLRQRLGLSFGEQRALWALIGHDVDPRVRQVLRTLATETGRGTSVGALLAMIYDGSRSGLGIVELSRTGRLAEARLIELEEPSAGESPFSERRLWACERTLELAFGVVRLDPAIRSFARLVDELEPAVELLIAPAVRSELADLAREAVEAARAGVTSAAVVLRGAEGAGRRSLVRSGLGPLGVPLIEVDCGALPAGAAPIDAALAATLREARIFGAALVFVSDGRTELAGALDRAGLSTLPHPVFLLVPPEAAVPRLARGCTCIDVPVPDEAGRRALWKRGLAALPAGEIDVLAARYPITGGAILAAAGGATARAAAHGRTPAVVDAHAAVRSAIDTRLGGLGTRVGVVQDWKDLVLPEDAMAEVRELIARLRHRRQVMESWGFGRKLATGRGLSALFSGPPGTGKTMVAGLIAGDLGLDLYRVDLSRIVSKWVGETEKNLASLFAAAESGHAILLFDEADSLFAKRTEVKSANDRYANLEVNYLLQRMEEFAGISILTTNHDAAIDDAFRRRLSFRIEFPMPDAEERVCLWRALIPDEAAVAADVDFEVLAERYELSGGHIRNVVLRAAYRAADDGRDIGMEHLVRAAALECASMGKVTYGLHGR